MADDSKKTCFIIMPITTPAELVERYKDDKEHFLHVLDCLFVPAVRNAGFDPIPPKQTGSDIIQAEIVNYHTYKSPLPHWEMDDEIEKLTKHVTNAFEKSNGKNSVWKYFGVAQTGVFRPEDATVSERIDLLSMEVASMNESLRQALLPARSAAGQGALYQMLAQRRVADLIAESSPELDEEKVSPVVVDLIRRMQGNERTPPNT